MGPLDGVRVVEVAGLAAAPLGCTVLADLGASVTRVDRADRAKRAGQAAPPADPLSRGRRSVAVNLKDPDGVAILLRLADNADVLVEAFRPGVAERLGFGPDVCLDRNPRLVYARMTGWGQDGPLASTAGHDIDYIAISGALSMVGRAGQRPVPPVNLAGDFGGGGMLLAIGVLAALVERDRSGTGQVLDVAMTDGSALLTALFYGLKAGGQWRTERGTNLIDGGAPFYDTYQTADGKFVAVGALEPAFYADLLAKLGSTQLGSHQLGSAQLGSTQLGSGDHPDLPDRDDPANWPALRERFAAIFRQRTRAEWTELFAGSDACVAPVLDLDEAPEHPHNQARAMFTEVGGVIQPAPAPRFSRTPADQPAPPPRLGGDTDTVLAGLGCTPAEIAALRARSVVA